MGWKIFIFLLYSTLLSILCAIFYILVLHLSLFFFFSFFLSLSSFLSYSITLSLILSLFSTFLLVHRTFSSPLYPEPYPIGHCTYHFSGRGKERVQILFMDFDLYLPTEHGPVKE